MQFLTHDLGQQRAGTRVRIDLRGTEANVQLLDSTNLAAYKAGRSYQYVGGHYNQSPVILAVPTTGHWHVTVDHGGRAGNSDVSVNVLSGS